MDSDHTALGGLSGLKGLLWKGGPASLRFFILSVEAVGKAGMRAARRAQKGHGVGDPPLSFVQGPRSLRARGADCRWRDVCWGQSNAGSRRSVGGASTVTVSCPERLCLGRCWRCLAAAWLCPPGPRPATSPCGAGWAGPRRTKRENQRLAGPWLWGDDTGGWAGMPTRCPGTWRMYFPRSCPSGQDFAAARGWASM